MVYVFLGLAVAALAWGVTGLIRNGQHSPEIDLSPMKAALGFQLLNQDAQTVSLKDFAGQPIVLSFFYVKCIDVRACPCTTKKFKKLQELTAGDGAFKPALIMISFDSVSDTPGKMRKYGELYGADFESWHFLTGTQEDIDRICSDYGIIQEKQDDGTFRHSVITFLIGPKLNIRDMYFLNQWEPEKIRKNIALLFDHKE